MYLDKWEILKEYLNGMIVMSNAMSNSSVKRALQNVYAKMNALEDKEETERDKLLHMAQESNKESK